MQHVINFLKNPFAAILGANATPRDKLLFTIGATAIAWYFLCITLIGFEIVTERSVVPVATSTTNGPNKVDLRQFMEFSITAISGTLATYLGMVLGLGQTQANPGQQAQQQISTMQKTAAWLYFGSLIYALALWGYFYSENKTPPEVITSLGQSILGLFGGALAVLLNTK